MSSSGGGGGAIRGAVGGGNALRGTNDRTAAKVTVCQFSAKGENVGLTVGHGIVATDDQWRLGGARGNKSNRKLKWHGKSTVSV